MASPLVAWLAPIATVLSLVALVVAVIALRSARKLPVGDVAAALREGDAARALELLGEKVASLEAAQQQVAIELGRLVNKQSHALQHAGMVRFDALNEQTGELSFALALLDDDKNGVVLSSINGRQQTRIYGKAMEEGRTSVALSDEEREAIARAMKSR